MEGKCPTQISIRHLHSTGKACEEIQHSSNRLTLRERQLLIMLASDEHLCDENQCGSKIYCDFCRSLMTKVDLQSLLDRGYITLADEVDSAEFIGIADNANYSHHPVDEVLQPVTMTHSDFEHKQGSNVEVATNDKDLSTILRFVSGNFDD